MHPKLHEPGAKAAPLLGNLGSTRSLGPPHNAPCVLDGALVWGDRGG